MCITDEQIKKAESYFIMTYLRKKIFRYRISKEDFIQECWVKFFSVGYDQNKSSLKTFCYMIGDNISCNRSKYYEHKGRKDSLQSFTLSNPCTSSMNVEKVFGVDVHDYLIQSSSNQKKDILYYDLCDFTSKISLGYSKVPGDFILKAEIEDPDLGSIAKKVKDSFGIKVSKQNIANWKAIVREKIKQCYM